MTTNIFSGKSCIFVAGAQNPGRLPAPKYPEVAFVGRSNVGKSSLLNALLGRKTLARVSKTPGRTRQINFFCLEQAVYLVDLPGYGYARASHQMLQDWEDLIVAYLRDRSTLQRVYLLVDSRHGLKPSDHVMMNFLDEASVPYQIVLTKIDKTPVSALAEVIDAIQRIIRIHKTALLSVIATSASQKRGLDSLREDVLSFCAT